MDPTFSAGVPEPPPDPEPHGIDLTYRRICLVAPPAAALTTTLAASAILIVGWYLNHPALRGQIGAAIPMMPVTALTFILAATALWLLRRESPASRLRLGGVLSVAVVTLGAGSLAQYLTGADLGLDRILAAGRLAGAGTPYPGRMAIGTGLSFILLGAALLGLATGGMHRLSYAFALCVAGISMFVLIGAIYDVQSEAAPLTTPMAIPTAVLFQALSAGILSARPDRGPLAMLGRRSPGGALARRLLPAAVLILPILGYLRLLVERVGLFSDDFGVALMVVTSVAILSGFVWLTAGALDRADRARLVAEEALQTNREQLQSIFDNTSYVMFIKDLEGRYLLVNREFERVTGLTRQEAVGRRVQDVVAGDEAQRIWACEQESVKTGAPVSFETVVPREDGRHDWLVTTCPLRDGRGAISGICGISQDVTDRKRAEEGLRHAKEMTEAANQELEAFAYSVSHDLRAPLRHISGFIDLLETRAGESLNETGRGYVRRIAAAAQRMGILIDDLLSFSRMGRAEMRHELVDLKALVTEVRGEVEQGVTGRRLTWAIGDLPEVRGDPAMLRLALANLFSNAVKYTAPRREALIDVQATYVNGEIVVCVRDNGVGFDPRYASKLFGVFQRLHRQDEFEGTGIGLASVRRIITRHGGRTWAEGEPDRGAAFYFSLPEREERAA